MAMIYPDQPIDPNSRATRKDNLEVLRQLGMSLVALPEGRFAKLQLQLPERIFNAVAEARRLTAPDARRRQLMHVQAAIDDCGADAVHAALDQVDKIPAPPSPEAPLAASLLDGGDDELFALSARFDVTQLQTLRQVVRRARKDLQGGKARDVCVKVVVDCLEAF